MKQGTSIQPGIDALLEINARHSKEFNDPVAKKLRKEYRLQHPTEIGALKCMDGRLHLPVMTETPLGIIQPFRNLGGKFDIGWHGFQQTVDEFVDYGIVWKGRNCLLFITYHYSRGDKHRGCRGFNYDKDAAVEYAENLKKQFETVYKDEVVTILCGIETDYESLVLHGESREVIDLSEYTDSSLESVFGLLNSIYPNMPTKIVNDLVPLMQGNIQHSAKVKSLARTEAETEHREWVLGVGRGFDWLHAINTALIIGPFDPELANNIDTAAGLIFDNFIEGKISAPGNTVLMVSAPYRDQRHERRRGQARRLAIEKAKFYTNYALEILRNNRKREAMLESMQCLTACVDVDTRELEVLGRRDSVL